MPELRGLERLWYSDDAAARLARLALSPLEAAYRGATALRGALYDAGVLPSRLPLLPALSVGNLSVGGTGKTPAAAWFAAELAARGARPAIVLRGYGGDEPLVHRQLNPGMVVIASPDRIAGIARAAGEGADLAVLDDAFQHRRSARDADVVLVSADRWTARRRLLPAGPWREPLRALRRASLVMVTRKAAPLGAAEQLLRELSHAAPGVPGAVARLALGELRHAADEPQLRPVSERSLAGERVLAISAIGDAAAFTQQLADLGADVSARSFPDHHAFTARDAEVLAEEVKSLSQGEGGGRALGGEGKADRRPLAVCTLKDAVKLAPLWPREAPPLWYVSQHLNVELGRSAVDALLTTILALRHRQP